ncbi:MAG: hypothetical protein N3A01_09145 [Bacteroidales bacterium]|nr:hypothetical protein [Bacteroidales bacterium]
MQKRKKIEDFFSVPENYFDNLTNEILLKIEKIDKEYQSLKKQKISVFIRYVSIAASFVIILFVSLFLIYTLNNSNKKLSNNELSHIIIDDLDIYTFQIYKNLEHTTNENVYDYYLILDNNESVIYEP